MRSEKGSVNNTFFYKNGPITMFLSKPSFSEHEFFFFSGGAFCTWIRCKISVRFVSSRIDELFCCSKKKQKERSVENANSECTRKKKNLWVQRIVFIFWVQRINSFFFLGAAPKRTQMLSGWATGWILFLGFKVQTHAS